MLDIPDALYYTKPLHSPSATRTGQSSGSWEGERGCLPRRSVSGRMAWTEQSTIFRGGLVSTAPSDNVLYVSTIT